MLTPQEPQAFCCQKRREINPCGHKYDHKGLKDESQSQRGHQKGHQKASPAVSRLEKSCSGEKDRSWQERASQNGFALYLKARVQRQNFPQVSQPSRGSSQPNVVLNVQ